MQRAFGLDIPQTLEDICDPTRLALVVYDLQVGIVKQIENGQQITERVVQVLEAARNARIRVTDATTGLFRDLDPLGRFMDECLESDVDAFTFTTDLVKAYTNFLLVNGEEQHIEQKTLTTQIRERGAYAAGVSRNAQGQQMRGVRGVKIKDPL
ncbi:MAG TPA: hypothetical protein VH350_01805 [Candidatus Sulfotelmatobacter sp.]|nr:hypothetical protein [Candidatus Sulfotelmatobacter sp.]